MAANEEARKIGGLDLVIATIIEKNINRKKCGSILEYLRNMEEFI